MNSLFFDTTHRNCETMSTITIPWNSSYKELNDHQSCNWPPSNDCNCDTILKEVFWFKQVYIIT